MTRKKPLLDQCPNTPPRRRSARRRLSKSPTKLQSQHQHNIKTRLPPSSPRSGTSESLYGDLGYQSPASIFLPSAALEVAGAPTHTKAKGKGKEVDIATYLPPRETLHNIPSESNHGKLLRIADGTAQADDQGESSQSSRLSSAPSTPRRVSQRPSNVQLRIDINDKLGESSQSSPLSTSPSERLVDPSSPLSPPRNYARVKKTRKRVKEPNTKEVRRNLANNTTMPKSSKSKQTRGCSSSSSISTIPDLDDLPGSTIPDIGLPMKDIWENLYANLEDHVPEVHVKEEQTSDSKAVEPIKKREPTKIPSR